VIRVSAIERENAGLRDVEAQGASLFFHRRCEEMAETQEDQKRDEILKRMLKTPPQPRDSSKSDRPESPDKRTTKKIETPDRA